jgi:CheY-like chemotaxis protein
MTMTGAIEVLLVEDNPSDVELTLRALQKRHIANRIMVARDGAEALAMLLPDDAAAGGAQPKVVLLDLKLPKVNGLEVLRHVRVTEGLKSVPVVMLTSSNEESDVLRSYELGVNAYVVKPVDFKQFVGAIADLGVFWAVLNEPPPGSMKTGRRYE